MDIPVPSQPFPFTTYEYKGHFAKAATIAERYGFNVVTVPKLQKKERSLKSPERFAESRVALLRAISEVRYDPKEQPLLLMYTEKVPYRPLRRLHLDIIGVSSGAAEAVLLYTTRAILREYGYDNLSLAINSVGGRNAQPHFRAELTAYYRTHLHATLNECPHCSVALKENLTDVLACTREQCAMIHENAPKPIHFLSESSRAHFHDVLEALEHFAIPYTIAHHLVGDERYTTRTIFELRAPHGRSGTPVSVAYGERYDNLGTLTRAHRDIPAIGVAIDTNCSSLRESYKERTGPQKPTAHIVQMGAPARFKGLMLMELLRTKNIDAHATFLEQTLAEQMRLAKKKSPPFLVIIGHKEAMENTAIVRHVESHTQATVPLEDIPRHIARFRI